MRQRQSEDKVQRFDIFSFPCYGSFEQLQQYQLESLGDKHIFVVSDGIVHCNKKTSSWRPGHFMFWQISKFEY